MRNFIKRLHPLYILTLFFAVCIVLLPVCGHAQKQHRDAATPELRFLDEYIIPFNHSFAGTTVGGLSGIDYDEKKNLYYVISDDRSAIHPARFYTLGIPIRNNRIDTVILTANTYLKDHGGAHFPPSAPGAPAVDPESIRLWNGDIIWSSEGQRTIAAGDTMLRNPQIMVADSLGQLRDKFVLPHAFRATAGNSGVRNNGGFEGLSISPGGQFLFVSTEEPLLQDGHRAGLNDSTAIVRIIKYDLASRKPVAQYAYQIEAVAHAVHPPGAFRLNGISEILCLSEDKILVVERSFSFGRLSCTIKVFIADLSGADDISALESVQDQKLRVAPKRLLLNMDNLDRFIDNIEGITFGPVLPSGNRSLIFIADNNFLPFQKNQFLLFEMLEPVGVER